MITLAGTVPLAQAGVTDRGSYQKSVSIEAPAYHGIAPSVQLNYDSNNGNGPVGLGWSLNAGSQISRTSSGRGVPHYNSTDQFWLDGMELIPCASASQSASCRTGGTHSTRVESYRRILRRSAGTSADVLARAGSGANTWTIWKPDGTRLIFEPHGGDITSPDHTRRWLLADVVDTHGNGVHYAYNCGLNSTCYLSDISYGAGKACLNGGKFGDPIPGVNLHFYWEVRPDPQSIAVGGELEEMDMRLRAIDVSQAGGRIRVYQLNYQPELNNSSGYMRFTSWLDSIQTFGSDAVVSAQGVVTSGTTSEVSVPALRFQAPAMLTEPARSVSNVFSGDGKFLPIQPRGASAKLPSVYNHRKTLPLGPSTPVGQSGAETGDFDGDGQLDFIQWRLSDDCNTITFRLDLAGRGTVDNTMPWSGPKIYLPEANVTVCPVQAYVVDLDGDGRKDLLFNAESNTSTFLISVISNGDGTFRVLPTAFDTSITQPLRCAVADINGDQRADFLCTQLVNGKLVVDEAISTGDGQFIPKEVPGPDGSDLAFSIGDANGDGRADILGIGMIAPSGATPFMGETMRIEIGVSQGDGTFAWRTQDTTVPVHFYDPDLSQIVLSGDFNGDGRTDIVVYTVAVDGSSSSIATFTSTGSLSPMYDVHQQTVVPAIQGAVSVGDADGDNRDDLLVAVHEYAHTCPVDGVDIDHDHPSLYIARSLGDGTFSFPPSLDGCYKAVDWPWQGSWLSGANARGADVNGDGLADFFQFWGSDDGYLVIADAPADIPSQDLTPWRSTDVNGDGRPDWVYVKYANPGLSIVSLIAQPDGTYARIPYEVPSELPSSTGVPDLSRAAIVRELFLADIGGGPNNKPDGRADIVLIDDLNHMVVSLLSNGDGTWRKVTRPYSNVSAYDAGNWLVMSIGFVLKLAKNASTGCRRMRNS
jgi:Salmonella virulence plasmid 65kDa B protein/FG-GAP-like repeat